MKRTAKVVVTVILLFFASGRLFAQNNPTDAQKTKVQADALEDRAAQAVDDGNMSQGLDYMSLAVNLDPTPARRMNYAGILYGDGMEMYKNIDQDKGQDILRRSEGELRKAIAAFNPHKDQAYLSQCYFLLGEMYSDAFGDKVKAREYLTRAASLSDYTGAKDALHKL